MKFVVYPKLKDAILLCVLMVALQFAYTFIFGVIAYILGITEASATYKYGTTVIQILAFLIPLILALQKIKLPFAEVIKFKRVSRRAFAYSLIFIFGFLIISSEIDNILNYVLPVPPFVKAAFDGFLSNDHVITVLLLVVLIPGFFEEFLFRGLLLHGFTQAYSIKRSIIYSAILFGLVHLNPWQFVGAFLIGVFSAWIFIKTGSLVISVVIHMINNGVYLLTTHFPELKPVQGFNGSFSTPTVFQPIWFDCMGVALALLGIYLLVTHFKTADKEAILANTGDRQDV